MLETVPPPQPAEPFAPAAPLTLAEPPAPAAPQTPAMTRSAAQYGWLSCSAVLLLAVIAGRWLLSSHISPGDPWAARLGESHKWWLVWDITRGYQQIGRPLVATGEVLVMIWWLLRNGNRRAIEGLVIVLVASLCCGVIKILCGPTPLWIALHHVGTNFPSGVVTFVTATGGYLALVARRQGRRLMPAMLIAVIVGAGPARVIGGQHLLSDVIGGYLLGSAWLLVAYTYLATPARRAQPHSSWAMPSLETLD
ncbi:MAG: phosphatase PAP2 family protein [Solirubrobacteraceae bacterium]